MHRLAPLVLLLAGCVHLGGSGRAEAEACEQRLSAATSDLEATRARLREAAPDLRWAAEARQALARREAAWRALEDGLRTLLPPGQGSVVRQGEELVVLLPDAGLFPDPGALEPSGEGRALLTSLGEVLAQVHGRPILVVAHTDDGRVRRKNRRVEDNLELSARRALAAARVLQEAGVPLERLRAAGAGASEAKDDDPLRLEIHVGLLPDERLPLPPEPAEG